MSNNKGQHQSKLDSLCQLPPDIPAIKAYLKELNIQAQHIADNSNDYPKQTISADIWMSGYQLVNTARALAEWLERQRLYELWPQAIECWGTAAFAVVAHYRAEIGPFMHAVMRLQKRRGNNQAVQEACRAILGDFTLLLEGAEELRDDGCTDPADYQEYSELAAISYLDLAARHLAEQGDSEAQAILQRLNRLPQYWATLKL